MWEGGSAFEFLLNQENLWEFPRGMSPSDPSSSGGPSLWIGNASFGEGLRAAKDGVARGGV